MHIHQMCIKHAVFITFAFRSSKKCEIMKPRVQTKLTGSSSTKTQGLFLFLPPWIFTNFCTCWLRFYRSITLWHFSRNPTALLNSYQCLRSLLRLAKGEAYQHYMEPSKHLLGENKNRRLVISFTPFDFYELLPVLQLYVALYKKPHSSA